MNKDKTSMSVWLTQEEKDIWKQLAHLQPELLLPYRPHISQRRTRPTFFSYKAVRILCLQSGKGSWVVYK